MQVDGLERVSEGGARRGSGGARDSPLAAALLVGFLALALGLVGLGAKSLWFDEAFDAVHASGSWHDVLSSALGHEASQAAYLIVLKPWLSVVPDDEWWLRLPSVLFIAAAAGMLVLLGTVLLDHRAGVIGGLLLAVNGFVVAWSQQARTYALVVLAVIVSTYLLVRALEPGAGRGRWVAYGAVAALSLYAHFFAGFVIAAHVVSAVVARPRPRTDHLLVAGTIIGAGALPAVWFATARDVGQISWIVPLSLGGVKGAVEEASGRNLLLVGLAVAGGALLAWSPPANASRATRALLVCWAALPFVLAVAVSVGKPILLGRYLIVATPALALLGAVAITSIRYRPLAYVTLAGCLAIGAARTVQWYRAPSVEGWREAIAYVDANRGANDQVFVEPREDDEPYRYYAGRPSAKGEPVSRKLWVVLGAETSRAALDGARAAVGSGLYRLHVARGRDEVFVVRGARG